MELTDLSQWRVAPELAWQETWSLWLQENGRVKKTVSAYLQDLRHFGAFFEKHTGGQSFEPSLLNAAAVKGYFATQDADKSVAPASRNRRLMSLRVLVAWAFDAGLLDCDPTVAIKRVPVEPAPRDRTKQEMEKLNKVVDANAHLRCKGEKHLWLGMRDHAIWILFNAAGLRISEVAGLDVTDIDFVSCTIHVLGKGSKKAPVEVSADALAEIKSWLEKRGVASDAVITDWDGNRVTSGQVGRRIKLIGDAANVGDLKSHDLRHTYGYALVDAFKAQGLPEFAIKNGVRRQMRHGDEKTTGLYFGIRDSQIRAAVEMLR
jgi:integrase/recombinase XerC